MDDGIDNRDIVGTGTEQRRVAERLSASGQAMWRRHTRPIVAALVTIGLIGGSVYGWAQAHPGPLSVPVLEVQATGVNPFFNPDVPSGEVILGGSLRLRLQLKVTASDRADETIEFAGLTGVGLAPITTPVTRLGTMESSAVDALARVNCSDWEGFSGIRAHFRLSRDGRTREVDVPVAARPDFDVITSIQRPCADYNASHLVRAVAVVETLDPVQPVIHLTWSIRNPTPDAIVIGGDGGVTFSAGESVSTLATGFEAGFRGAQRLAADSTGALRTTLIVTGCDDPPKLSLANQSYFLYGYSDTPGGTVDNAAVSFKVDLPFEATDRAQALARQACRGAPHLITDGAALVIPKGTAPAMATVTGQLVAQSGSGPPFTPAGTTVWITSDFSYRLGGGAVPLSRPAVADSAGRFNIVSPIRDYLCLLLLGRPLRVIVKGDREFPFLATISSTTGVNRC